MKNIFLHLFLGTIFFVLGCSDFRQVTGREKVKLDEFTILEQKSLEIPETFDLNFSQITSSQESNSKDTFNKLVNINVRKEMDETDLLFANYFNLDEIETGIREKVFSETQGLKKINSSGFDRLTKTEYKPLENEILNVDEEIIRLKNLGIIVSN